MMMNNTEHGVSTHRTLSFINDKIRSSFPVLPTPTDSSIVVYIHCIKQSADVNVKLKISNNTMPRVIYSTPIPRGIPG